MKEDLSSILGLRGCQSLVLDGTDDAGRVIRYFDSYSADT
jgi:hypothetical protein